MKPKVAVSACLLGENCKYSGGNNRCEAVTELSEFVEFVPVCPEVMGGLSVPRVPAELQADGSVKTAKGTDVTAEYLRGAELALEMSRKENCIAAVVKRRSPSCGIGKIYDGSFSGALIDGDGIFASLIKREGIPVFGEDQTELLKELLKATAEEDEK